MTNEEKRARELCSKQELSFKEIKELAYTNMHGFSYGTYRWVWSVVMGILKEEGEEWDDHDPDYPNNTYNCGYVFNGDIFITGYTGNAGCYWNDEQNFSVCRPW